MIKLSIREIYVKDGSTGFKKIVLSDIDKIRIFYNDHQRWKFFGSIMRHSGMNNKIEVQLNEEFFSYEVLLENSEEYYALKGLALCWTNAGINLDYYELGKRVYLSDY